ncbi:MAG: Gfo/Idh/MocA family oxidoreductase [Actinomycetota bacterium]
MTDLTPQEPPHAGGSNGPIRYGMIGTGMMGTEHIHNINAIDGADVVSISDPHPDSLDTGRTAVADGRDPGDVPPEVAAFADHRDLLAAGEVDAVVISSPNHTHRAVLEDVLSTGVHVLIEKPLCTTVQDCLAVADLVAATAPQFPDRVVQVGLEYRYMPPVAHLIEQVAGGAVGGVRMVAIREHRFPFRVKVGDWNRLSANTGGTLVEKCCHFFDLMNLVLDERPARVMASGAQDVNHLDEVYDGRPSDILDNAYVIVEYPSGRRAMLDLCMFAEATRYQEEISVVGDAGKVEAFLPEGVFRLGVRGEHWVGDVADQKVDDSHIAYQGLHHGSSYLEHLDFIAAIEGRAEVPVTIEDGLWSVAMGVAAHRSIEEGRAVDLAEVMERTEEDAR